MGSWNLLELEVILGPTHVLVWDQKGAVFMLESAWWHLNSCISLCVTQVPSPDGNTLSQAESQEGLPRRREDSQLPAIALRAGNPPLCAEHQTFIGHPNTPVLFTADLLSQKFQCFSVVS